jgi:hypothetical protein
VVVELVEVAAAVVVELMEVAAEVVATGAEVELVPPPVSSPQAATSNTSTQRILDVVRTSTPLSCDEETVVLPPPPVPPAIPT